MRQLLRGLPLLIKAGSNFSLIHQLGHSVSIHRYPIPQFPVDYDPDVAPIQDATFGPFRQSNSKQEQPFPYDPAALQQTAPDSPEAVFIIGSVSIYWPNLIQALIILFVTFLLIITSVIIICVILSAEDLRNQLGFYLISLSCADLICGMLMTPLSIYSSLDDQWKVPYVICKLEAYVGIVLWSACAFTFCWLSIDRYAALHKPSRYEVEQTRTRSKAWITFSWVTSILICCPTLFAEMRSVFYQPAHICLLDWSAMKAYSVTLAILVILPNLFFVSFAYSYIFARFREEEPDQEIRSIIENNTSFMMTFFVIIVFVISWSPWFSLRAYEAIMNEDFDVPILHFSLVWLAIGGGSWKLLIYTTINKDFRRAFCAFCSQLSCFCARRNRHNSQNSSPAATNRYVVANRQRFI